MMDNIIDTLHFYGPENAQPASSTVTNWPIVTLGKSMGYIWLRHFEPKLVVSLSIVTNLYNM